jgi:hypothetical protein
VSLPPRLVTREEVEDFLALYEAELDLPSHQKAVLRQGLAMTHEALAKATPHDQVVWIPDATRQAVYRRAAGHCEYCTDPVRRRGQVRSPADSEIDHMVARWPLLQAGATWDTIHDPANVIQSCGRCNGEKLTVSLPPTDLMRMWETLGIDGTTNGAQLLLFYAALLATRPFNIRRFDGPKPRDWRSIVQRIQAGYNRLHGNEQRRALAERVLCSSEDARDLWVGPNGRRVNSQTDYGPRRDASGRPLPLMAKGD